MADLSLVVVHHHLLRGGVTSVIRQGLLALARYGPWDALKVTLLTGAPNDLATFLDSLGAQTNPQLRVDVEVNPLLAYRSTPWQSKEDFGSEADSVCNYIAGVCRNCGADAVWVHNPTLGKNPAVSAGLFRLVQRNPSLRVLYHIHDFAECGRVSNLEFLRDCVPGGMTDELYPCAPNFSLVCLTHSDRERLLGAGYPEDAVVTLHNPVARNEAVRSLGAEDRIEAERKIAQWSRRHGFAFEQGGSWLLSPIRTIRRKNVLEQALVLLLSRKPWRLLVTLDCNSEPERPYAELVKECFRRERLSATIGFLSDLDLDFNTIFGSADSIISTSVMEGFGLAFAESALARKPLIGRDLPGITDEFDALPHERLYDALYVPLDRAEKDRLAAAYRRKILSWGMRAQVNAEITEQTLVSIRKELENPAVDFALLDPPAQARTIHKMKDDQFASGMRELNRQQIAMLDGEPEEFSLERQERLSRSLGPDRFAREFTEILRSKAGTDAVDSAAVCRSLCSQFFRPQTLRLLLDSGDEWRLWPERLLPKYVSGAQRLHQASSKRRAPAGKVVFWDVYSTLLMPRIGDLEQRMSMRQAPEGFLSALTRAGLNPSEAVAEPAEMFRQLIEEDHERARQLGLQQPEVVIEDVWRRLVERALPGQWVSVDQARFLAARFELETNRVQARPGAANVMFSLSEAGYRLGILSNAQFYTPEILRYALGKNIWSLFDPDLLIWSYETGAAKPDPAPFARAEAALARIGCWLQNVILVGDSLANDIEPAKRRGWTAIHLLPGGAQESPDESSPADLTCENLDQAVEWLTKADGGI